MIKEEKSNCSSSNDNRVLRLLVNNLCFSNRLICRERTGNIGNRVSSNDAIRSLGNRN
jgi:hypothetical protein